MYNLKKADKYWSTRAKTTNKINAVLHIRLPEYANYAHDRWFKSLSKKVLGDVAGLKILDMGCGLGRVLIPLAEEKALLTGVDISKEMLKICRSEVKKKGLEKSVNLVHGGVDKLPFFKNSFDVVIATELLFHLPDKVLNETIAEINRVTKSSGKVIITATNPSSIFLSSVRVSSRQRDDGYYFTGKKIEDLNNKFRDNGFTVILMRGFSLTSVLNGLRNGHYFYNRVYVKLMQRFGFIFKPIYYLTSQVDKSLNLPLIHKKLTNLYFITYIKDD